MGNSSSILVIEGSTGTMARSSAQVELEAVYLPVTFFESALSLERKDLAPELVGLCQGDLCIPLPLRSYEGDECVSSRKLIEALSGAYLWDDDASQLLLNLRPQYDQDPTQGLFNFALTDLEGRKIQLSHYRGKLVRGPTQTNIDRESDWKEIASWLRTGSIDSSSKSTKAAGFTTPEAKLRFEAAAVALAKEKPGAALALLESALQLDSKNWIIRKQIWAIQNPDRFYNGPIDFDWQKQQLKKDTGH